jgi:hypothetical protein
MGDTHTKGLDPDGGATPYDSIQRGGFIIGFDLRGEGGHSAGSDPARQLQNNVRVITMVLEDQFSGKKRIYKILCMTFKNKYVESFTSDWVMDTFPHPAWF